MATKYLTFSEGVEAAIAAHKKHLGANENPGGSNRTWYGKHYGMDGVYYCAIAIWSTNDVSGNSAASVKSASSSAIKAWGRSVGRNVSTPQRGDYIHVYKNNTSVHIERVLSYKNGKLVCIGSNTSNTSGGSTANGGGTYINDRTSWWNNRNSKHGWSIQGITRPLYGLSRENLVLLQKRLSLRADGVFGPTTKEAVKAAQKRHGLKVDGFPGPITLGVIIDGVKVNNTKPAVSQSKPAASLKLDRVFDVEDTKELQRRLGVKADGKIGEVTIKAWQKHEGTKVDGKISGQVTAIDAAFPTINKSCIERGGGGSSLIAAVQRNVSQKDDGYAGGDFALAITRAMNVNKNAFK